MNSALQQTVCPINILKENRKVSCYQYKPTGSGVTTASVGRKRGAYWHIKSHIGFQLA